MDSSKVDNQLNIALDVGEDVRGKTIDLDVGFNGSGMMVIGSGSDKKYLAYTTDFCNFDYGYSYLLTDIDSSEVIVKNEDYQFIGFDLYLMSGYCNDGESYYYGDIKYIMDKKVYEEDE